MDIDVLLLITLGPAWEPIGGRMIYMTAMIVPSHTTQY